MPPTRNILALDIGEARIGVALASVEAQLPHALVTLPNNAGLNATLQNLIDQSNIVALVVGLPRGMEGQETAQTAKVRQLAAELKKRFGLPVYFQDEALTSYKAEEELKARGRAYTKEDIDALSATYILEDFLKEGRTI